MSLLNNASITGTIFVLWSLCQSQVVWADKPIIRAAVAKEFKNGLHASYLKYIANQLDMDIIISTMPLARRIIEVRKGNLDLIIGLKYSKERAKELVYIYPAYENISFKFFALNRDASHLTRYEHLLSKHIGVVRGAKYYDAFEQDNNLKKYEVKSLDSSIKMLLHGRIDLFIHYEESTMVMLKALQVEGEISQTKYQLNHNHEHYVAVSKHSPLFAKQQQLKAIIEKGLKQRDFIQLRLNHYQDKALNLTDSSNH